jgi:23S rRNA pseudouridine1911/1915/1917 synthase
MGERIRRDIPEYLKGERADKVVAELAGVSRVRARGLFDLGVTIDGAAVDPKTRLEGGVIEFPIPPQKQVAEPESVPFGVRYEDDDLIVVDKPAGLVVHPGAGRIAGTLAAGLMHRYPDLVGVGQEGRWGIVHRLDQGTSGLMVVARNQDTYAKLASDMAARRIHRSYLCLVHGVPSMPTGTVDAPIGRDPQHPTRKKVVADGRPARTHYRVVSEHGVAALLEVELETGRTHQIRVHLAAIGHPVVGDRAYSRRVDPVAVTRIFLHAARLQFVHPRTGEEIVVESPLPEDLSASLTELVSLYPTAPDTVTT